MKLLPRYCFPAILLIALLFTVGCENKPSASQNIDHPGYLDKAFEPLKGMVVNRKTHLLRIDSAYNALKDPGPGDKWDRYYYLFVYSFRDVVNYTKAHIYLDSMQYVLQEYKSDESYTERYAKTLFYNGDLLFDEGRFAESFTFYYNAREVILQKKDPCILSEYSSRLAAVTFRQERFKDAAEYYKQAVRDLEGCPKLSSARFGDIQGSLDNIGIAYVKAGMNDSADLYFNKALAYIDNNVQFYPDRSSDFIDIAKAVIYGNQASVAIKRKKYDAAEKLLKESIRINIMPGHPDEDAAFSIIKLSRIYLEQNRLAELEEQLNILTALSIKHPHNADVARNLNLLQSKLSDKKGDKIKAYQYLLRYQNIMDSVKQGSPIGATDMQQAVDNISRQYQLDILAKDNKRKSDYLWLTIVIATMAIAIIFLVWINYRRSKKNVATLVSLNSAVNNKNQALLQTLAAVEQSHNNNTRLLKVVAHDLRGPLGAITSIAELARDGMLPGEKYQDVMAVIFRSGNKALTLANHLLIDMQNIGRINNAEPLNIAEKLSSCVELYEHRIKEKEQKVILKTVTAFVSGEREKLWRVFSNLISNAVKFTKIGGEINISMRIDEEDVLISIHDNGIGIPDDLKERIFEPTEATTRPGTIGERSFGLGLSIAKNIVALHGGRLWFESSSADGTSFYVSLPLLKTEHTS